MKKQRPTIPISEWKISVHLAATREIQNQKGMPAYACECEWCANWKQCLFDVLPKEIIEQLARIGVQLEHPTDLYEFDSSKNGTSIRVVYHAVGKILSGPNQWVNNDMGKMLMYHSISKQPYLSLVVLPQSQYFGQAPALTNSAAGDLLRIDFRLEIQDELIRSYV